MAQTSSVIQPEAVAALNELMRNEPPWRKLEMSSEMYARTKGLATAQLRQLYPDAAAEETHRRLADVLLGADVALEVYGPLGSEMEPTILVDTSGNPCDIKSLGDGVTKLYHQELFEQLLSGNR